MHAAINSMLKNLQFKDKKDLGFSQEPTDTIEKYVRDKIEQDSA